MLCAIETDKATMDYEMQEEGFVAKLLYPDGAKDIPLGTPLAIMVEDEEDIAAFADYDPSQADAPSTPESAAEVEVDTAAAAEVEVDTAVPQTQAAAPQVGGQKAAGGRIFVSPLAKKVAEEAGLALEGITGTGPNDRILKADVDEALAAAKAAPAKAAPAKAPPAKKAAAAAP